MCADQDDEIDDWYVKPKKNRRAKLRSRQEDC